MGIPEMIEACVDNMQALTVGNLFGSARRAHPRREHRGYEEHQDDLRYDPGTYIPPPPFWHNRNKGAYDGPVDWWTELGYEDPIINRGRNRPFCYTYREDDPLFWDPPVKKGESRIGPDGYDTAYVPTSMFKMNRVGDLHEWQEKQMRSNAVSKQIYDKYDIHPNNRFIRTGEAGVPNYENLEVHKWAHVANREAHSSWTLQKPRFYDSPLGEACVEKTFACMKNAFFATAPFSVWHICRNVRKYNKYGHFRCVILPSTWIKVAPKIQGIWVLMAGVWGGTLCLASRWRGKVDDIYNYPIASAAACSVYACTHRHAAVYAAVMFVLSTFAGTYYSVASNWYSGFWGPESYRIQSARGPLDTQQWHRIGKNWQPEGKVWWEDGPEPVERGKLFRA